MVRPITATRTTLSVIANEIGTSRTAWQLIGSHKLYGNVVARTKFLACMFFGGGENPRMFSHIVIFWTDPAQPLAADELVAGANKYLKQIPGLVHFHVGKMSPSPRPVVDQSYQVALNLIFLSKQAEQNYQVHPQHLEFVEKVFKPLCKKAVIYDFE